MFSCQHLPSQGFTLHTPWNFPHDLFLPVSKQYLRLDCVPVAVGVWHGSEHSVHSPQSKNNIRRVPQYDEPRTLSLQKTSSPRRIELGVWRRSVRTYIQVCVCAGVCGCVRASARVRMRVRVVLAVFLIANNHRLTANVEWFLLKLFFSAVEHNESWKWVDR